MTAPTDAEREKRGAVDLSECPRKRNRCECGRCVVCGFQKHMAVHGPVFGAGPGSKPWGHEFADAIRRRQEG